MARVKANDTDILRLLKENRTVYVIPRYQRSYAWEEQSQLNDLWEDILETVINKGEELFTGSIIISDTDKVLLENVDENCFYRDVIDGQQRLTTILILLRALYDSISEDRKNWAYSNIYEPYFLAHRDGEKRLRLSYQDQNFFDDFILDVSNLVAPPRRHQRPSEKRLSKALAFFKTKIGQIEAEDRDNFIENFFNKMKDNLTVVLIEARSDVDAYTIFETINSKNRDLTPSELLKNYFYSAVSKSPALLKTVTSQWESVAEELAVNNVDITEYIRHYWISTHEGKVSENKLYRAIKEDIKRNEAKVKQLLIELKKEVNIYSEIANPLDSSKDVSEKYFAQLKELGIKQCYPLLLALKAINYAGTAEVLKMIIFISLRRGIADRNPNELENLYSSYGYQIRKHGKEKVVDFLNELKTFDITDDSFTEALLVAPLSRKTAKFILMRLEEERRTGETRLHPQDVEVEHIMPSSPENLNDWGIELDDHKVWLETLGNKTLVGPSFNKEMSNKNFLIKKEIYKKSEIKMTQDLANNYKEWNMINIESRTREMSEKLSAIYRTSANSAKK